MKHANTIAYLNGTFQPLDQVTLSPLDRGFLFADGVYEVIPVFGGCPFLLERHVQRLYRSLDAVRINRHGLVDITDVLHELVDLNGADDLALYLQVTRGTAPTRTHAFPTDAEPTVFATASPLDPLSTNVTADGVSAVTCPDTRWLRCDIKSTALLPNVLARQQAIEAGATEAIFVRDGNAVEGAATNLFAVLAGTVVTPGIDQNILAGITRGFVMEQCAHLGIPVQEMPLAVDHLFSADELWLSSSTKDVIPVTRLDGVPIGPGRPGPVWKRLDTALRQAKTAYCAHSRWNKA